MIDYNGDVRACELREKFATLREYTITISKTLGSSRKTDELDAIDEGRACWCTHVCFIHDSMRHSRRALLYEVPKNYLTHRRW